MATMGKSMKLATRLAAATALSGSLAACDGRFGRAAETMFAPISFDTPIEAAQRSPAPAAPGNPVFNGETRAENERQYQLAYGNPLPGSGQNLVPTQSFARPAFQDSAITATPITDIPGGPVIDAGVTYSSPVIDAQPITYSTPAPVSLRQQPAFPTLGDDPVTLPRSIAPRSNLLPTTIFSDAAAVVESVDSMPMQSVPYGSTASHRYTAEAEPVASVTMAIAEPMMSVGMAQDVSAFEYSAPAYSAPEFFASDHAASEYSVPMDIIETEISETNFVTAEPIETVEVAALGAAYMPIPRARPSSLGVAPMVEVQPTIEVASIATPAPEARPTLLTSPVPAPRPVQYAALSGQAITDAPALNEPPQMIEVEAIFLEDMVDKKVEEAAPVETASLAPLEIEVEMPEPVQQPVMTEVAPAPTETEVREPASLSRDMAAIDTSKLKAPELSSTAPRVEIAEDVGELKELSGTSWRLERLHGENVPASAELHFDGTSGFAGGQGICNNYGGEFSESLRGAFNMGNIFSTETRCEHFDLERDYIVALEGASGYRTTPGLRELQLLDENGDIVATFAAF